MSAEPVRGHRGDRVRSRSAATGTRRREPGVDEGRSSRCWAERGGRPRSSASSPPDRRLGECSSPVTSDHRPRRRPCLIGSPTVFAVDNLLTEREPAADADCGTSDVTPADAGGRLLEQFDLTMRGQLCRHTRWDARRLDLAMTWSANPVIFSTSHDGLDPAAAHHVEIIRALVASGSPSCSPQNSKRRTSWPTGSRCSTKVGCGTGNPTN